MKDLERMMEAMSYVDHGLVEEAARPAKRRSRLGRVVLIAACLCLALTGTVLAVEKIFGVRLGWIEQSLNHSAYSVQAEVKQFDMTQFSRELQQDLERVHWTGHGTTGSRCRSMWECPSYIVSFWIRLKWASPSEPDMRWTAD